MMLARLLNFFGRTQRCQKHRVVAKRSRRLAVESLEDRSLMAAVADLVAYRPITEYINYATHRVPDAIEADPVSGPGIRINGDDDNGNLQPDYADSSTSPSGDNDLVRVDATGSGSAFSVSWNGPLAVWTTQTKAAAVSNGGLIAAGQSLWVEYVSQTHTVDASSASLTLTVTDTATATVDTDIVVFHSFQSVVIAIGGNNQDPRKFGDRRLGVFIMGGTLYDKGYDVHLYAYGQIQSNGRGAAYNEVVSAVLNRNVDNVAIFGYSWGGGATYQLSAGLNANTTLAPAGYKLQYTAYVDGIRRSSVSAERRLPIATQYHDNFYQRKDYIIRGNSVNGANNVNVTLTSWGKVLIHTTIDDNAALQGLLVNKLMTRVIA